VLASRIDAAAAERQTLRFLEAWVESRRSPMCGNSICQDRRFLARYMPSLERFFHYRNLDVSTLKELAQRWAPHISSGFHKNASHLAQDDVRESIRELEYYREHLLRTLGAASL
jgi:oligoribonuclease